MDDATSTHSDAVDAASSDESSDESEDEEDQSAFVAQQMGGADAQQCEARRFPERVRKTSLGIIALLAASSFAPQVQQIPEFT